jgi:hypothetical protein
MNAIGDKESLKTATVSPNDPFNFPTATKSMWMNTITACDGFKTTTQRFKSPRQTSSNLRNDDIQG